MPKRPTLGDLQHTIMRILWQHGEATVSDVHEALQASRPLAPTTVATMLQKMERKGVVAHRTQGRRFVYRPLVSEEEVRRSMVSELTERLFDGDAAALVSHLISEHPVERQELEQLKQLLEEREAEERGG